jgi:hypothetical protein
MLPGCWTDPARPRRVGHAAPAGRGDWRGHGRPDRLGQPGAGRGQVLELEHQADQVKRELRLAFTNAFITPIDAEDLYVMSERLDAVLLGAKDAVRVGRDGDPAR